MLARLRHYRFVRRDDEHYHIESVRAREHVLHEPLVARHVYEPEAEIAYRQVGKPYVYGDAAMLLFLEPVRVDPGQRLDKRRLSVIYVPGGSDYYVLHTFRFSCQLRILPYYVRSDEPSTKGSASTFPPAASTSSRPTIRSTASRPL